MAKVTPNADEPPERRASARLSVAVAACKAVALIYAGTAVLLAILVPYHAWDALPLGGWSRFIAETGSLRFSGSGDWAWYYHRPLFYVTQGWVWRLFGFHESLGRLLALAFAFLLVYAVYVLGRRGPSPIAAAWLGVLVLLAVPDFADGAISGLTDVPIAALVAATAALVWCGGRIWWRVPAIALSAAAAGLAKPSAFPALVGLGVAAFVGDRRSLGERLRESTAPVAIGCGLALSWHAYQAHALAQPLTDFLRTGTMGFYAEMAAQTRRGALLRVDWLGPGLAVLVAFSILYALLRVAGFGHARVARVAAPLALAVAWLGPWMAGGSQNVWVGPLASGSVAVSTGLLAAALLLAAGGPAACVPSREDLARLLVWAAPPFVAWAMVSPYATRLLSGAWPPLILLVSTTAMPAFAWQRRAVPLQAAAGIALLVLAIGNSRSLDGGWGWREVGAAASAKMHGRVVHRPGMGAIEQVLGIIEPELGSRGRLFSQGRFGFFFPGRHTSQFPQGCEDLRDHQIFVLLTDKGSRAQQQRATAAPADPSFWTACARPTLTEIGRVGNYVIFRIVAPSTF